MNNRMNDDYAIDLAQYYGVSFSGSDKSSASTNYHPNLPSLEQIASYNLQNARAEAARQSIAQKVRQKEEIQQRAKQAGQQYQDCKIKLEAEQRRVLDLTAQLKSGEEDKENN